MKQSGNLVTSSGSSEGGGQNLVYGYITASPKSYALIKDLRNELKKKPTLAEALLWKYLRNKSTGYKIRRQHMIGRFITDFVCLKKKLIIEVDGKIHDKQKDYDELRTKELNTLGYKVIRFTNEEVLSDSEMVAQKIKDYLNNED